MTSIGPRGPASWPADGGTRAVLARTNRELLPAVAAALRLRCRSGAADLVLPIESPLVDELLGSAAESSGRSRPGSPASRDRSRARAGSRAARPESDPPAGERDDEAAIERDRIAAAVLGWAAGSPDLASLASRIDAIRRLLGSLRRDDAPLTLATAHGTKGLEFDHVAVVGHDEGRFPSARSIADAVEPERALEEERRLAYVAWTRARRSLTLLYDPGAPSHFLLEAFDRAELGIPAA